MPQRITIPLPPRKEESRLLAESIADLHYVLSLIVENASNLLPGESVEEVTSAWRQSEESFHSLVSALLFTPAPDSPPAPIQADLSNNELTGETGKLKRNWLQRLKDKFFMYWYSEPRTNETTEKAEEAANEYLELGETVVNSIPGYDKVVEIVSTVRQLINIRRKRRV